MKNYDICIIGGGFFGLYLASYFSRNKVKVLLIEANKDFMTRASYNNQARVHNGYHYPRSVLTALRSRSSFPKFVNDFSNCVVNDFDKYYMIGKNLSKVTSSQFERFCHRIGAYLEVAPKHICDLTNSDYIDAVFSAKEYAFDACKLKTEILERIDNNYSTLLLNTEAQSIQKNINGELSITIRDLKTNEEPVINVKHVFNCTYANLNYVINNSKLELIPLKHEMTEMCLVEVPDEIKHLGITVMCGPFFSIMPFPSVTNNGHYLHSLSHVRYTPHYEWHTKNTPSFIPPYSKLNNDQKNTAFIHMIKDASRYIPCLENCEYKKSLWEIKTVLPRSETDDSRPILCMFNYSGIKGFHCIMGGKIDNAYDAVSAIKTELGL